MIREVLIFNRSNILELNPIPRDFFDRDGSVLSGEQDLIHFFALPFVSRPEEHPAFRVLFQVNIEKIFFADLFALEQNHLEDFLKKKNRNHLFHFFEIHNQSKDDVRTYCVNY